MSSSAPVSNSAEPKYVWFAGHLRRQIEQGTLKPGDRLPSRHESREQHQITQPTIERAQAILEREGLIVRRGRQGVFVAERGVANRENTPGTPGQGRLSAGTIGILTPDEGEVRPGHRQQGWSDYITQGAISACREQGKHVLLLNPQRLHGEELEQLLAYPLLGFVYPLSSILDYSELPSILRSLRDAGRHVVVFGNEIQEFDRVACDHEAGCYMLTRWLIQKGCRNILPFWPRVGPGTRWLQERLAGYRKAMAEAGLDPLPIREVPLNHAPLEPDDTLSKFDATVRHKVGYLVDYLGHGRSIDAILEVSDGDVPATAVACRLLGHEPNVDVLIAGYDNYWRDATELAFEQIPPIATVDKHNWQAGRELVEILLARAEGKLEPHPHVQYVQPELMPLEGFAVRSEKQGIQVAA